MASRKRAVIVGQPEFQGGHSPVRAERRKLMQTLLNASIEALDDRMARMAADRHSVPEDLCTDWLMIPRALGDQVDEFVQEWTQSRRVATCGALIRLAALALHMAEDCVFWQIPNEGPCEVCGEVHPQPTAEAPWQGVK